MNSGELPPYVESMVANVAGIGAKTLEAITTASHLAELNVGIYGFCEDILRDLHAQEPPPEVIACDKGCWYCCISPVIEALPLEVLAIAATLQGQDVPNLNAGTEHDAGRVCPLLNDQSCSIYALRPFVCRSYNAYDATACRKRKVDGENVRIFGYAHQGFVYQAALSGLAEACRLRGLQSNLVDLPSALALALEDVESCTQRWLDGKDAFPTLDATEK